MLERGAVEGEIFHRGAVQALAPEETQVTTRLAALVRRELIRPDRAQLAGDDGYRFRHLLIRDAAYDALPKAIRADLHARFADWLDEHGQALVELDEIVGYHLEQAARYHAELGRPDPALAERAAERLAAAGRRANDRLDGRAALALLTRAAELLRPHRLDLALELEAAWANERVDARAAAQAADAVAERAEAAGDRSGAMLARALALFLRMHQRRRSLVPTSRRSSAAQRSPSRRSGATHGGSRCSGSCSPSRRTSGCRTTTPSTPPSRLSATTASPATPPPARWIDWALILGPRPADEGLRMLDELAAGRPPGAADLGRAVLLAMLGRIDEAWPLAEARSDHLREVSGGIRVGKRVPRG